MSKRRKSSREQDLTRRYLAGDLDEDAVESSQRFTIRSKDRERSKIAQTMELRHAQDLTAELAELPIGRVTQVYSRFVEVDLESVGKTEPNTTSTTPVTYLCTVRKTLTKSPGSQVVVGDRVRLRPTAATGERGLPQASIEDILDRLSLLTRSDSFSGQQEHPIVANAEQLLLVASLWQPFPRWGLIDRMLVAAQSGKLRPVVCLNKIDLAGLDLDAQAQLDQAELALAHYTRLGIRTVQTSVIQNTGLEEVADILKDRTTVLAGHSGVGKSSLIRAIDPTLDVRVGEVSLVHNKGRHTTSSARSYPLRGGGAVIDTPGVKLFGLWNVDRDNLIEFFPDVADNTAPTWRVESYQRILESL